MNGQYLKLLPSEEFKRAIGQHWKSCGILTEAEGLFVEVEVLPYTRLDFSQNHQGSIVFGEALLFL